MNDKINELLERVEAFKPKAAAEIEDFRIRMLGKKGELTQNGPAAGLRPAAGGWAEPTRRRPPARPTKKAPGLPFQRHNLTL